jgi:hypothetical protein
MAGRNLVLYAGEYRDNTLGLDADVSAVTFPASAAVRVSGIIKRNGSQVGTYQADIASDVGTVVTVSSITGVSAGNRLAMIARWDAWIRSLVPEYTFSLTWN